MSSDAVRPAAVAGRFYPAQPARLRAQVQGFLETARLPELPGAVRAVIAPHAGYVYSGPVAGYSFAALPDPAGRTVFLMGPAHYLPVDGVAVGTFAAMETPLGRVRVAEETGSCLRERAGFLAFDAAHAPEHSLEVELPFLQMVAGGDFGVVPMLFGRANPQNAAAALLDCLSDDPQALVAVSSDLSHFHDYESARRRDTAFLDALLAGDEGAVRRGEACGKWPILTLMALAARRGWQPHLLDYRNSGDTGGDRRQVVGYAAVAYTSLEAS